MAILAPSTRTTPTCSQARANGRTPVTASAIAASYAWCGKRRSAPPACRSRAGPYVVSAMAAHSACQPGRPSPHSLGQPGSPFADGRQIATSAGSSLRGSPPPEAGSSPNSASRRAASSAPIRPRSRTPAPRKYTAPSRSYAWPSSSRARASATTCGT
nr:hypothetical protein [Microbispora sp. GKU 823]